MARIVDLLSPRSVVIQTVLRTVLTKRRVVAPCLTAVKHVRCLMFLRVGRRTSHWSQDPTVTEFGARSETDLDYTGITHTNYKCIPRFSR
jgi:hypothetical protein